MEEYSVIGKPVPRVDALEKVTGEAKYAADFSFPGMLWCKILRSPFPHARILNIDTGPAESYPGVKAVCTGKDFHGWTWGFMPQTRDEPPLAVDKVRYMGEAVAAVAAVDEETAEEAAQLIRVEYEELPGVFDPEEAMKPGSPAVHDYVQNNQSWEFHMDFGDVEKAFAESDIVREDRFETGRVLTGYLEPPAAVALYDSDGITLWGAKQSPYFVYRHMAACFNLPLNKIRIIQPFIGAGFGGTKNDSVAGDFCSALLSKWTGRPVKFIYTMEEVLKTARRRHNFIVHSKMGMKKDGTLMALQQKAIAEGGSVHCYRAADALPQRRFDNTPLQASEFQVRRLSNLYKPSRKCGHERAWSNPHPFCGGNSNGHDCRGTRHRSNGYSLEECRQSPSRNHQQSDSQELRTYRRLRDT